MAVLYLLPNGVAQTTAALVKVTTGNTIKTMLQLKSLAGIDLFIAEWGISFDGSAAATPGQIELIETDVAATVTASASADVTRQTDPAGPAADTGLISLGTAATGYTATVEGTITAVRNLDMPQFIAPTGQFIKQFPLGQWPRLQAQKFGRIRVTFGTAVNAYCYIVFAASQG